jgi:MFS family permease
LGLSIYFFLFNLFLIDHGYSERRLGVIASAMAAGNLTGAIPAGRLIQRQGLRFALLTCIVLAIAVFSARAIWLSFALQIGLAFIAGISLSLWAICISPTVAQLTEERHRPFAFSLFFSLGIGVGAIAGVLGGRLPGYLQGLSASEHTADLKRIVLLLSCAIVALGIWPAAKMKLIRSQIPARSRPLLSPFLLRFLPAIAVWSLVTGSFSPFATVYFSSHLHMSLPEVGTVFSFSQLAQVAAVLTAPLVLRKWGMITGIVSMQFVTALCLFSLALVHLPMQAGFIYIGFTAFQYMNEPGTYSLLMNGVAEEDRGGAAASNSLVMSSVQMAGAFLAGQVFERFGYASSLTGIGIIALIAAALFWILLGRTGKLNDV